MIPVDELINSIIDDLSVELAGETGYSETVLRSKVTNAANEVRRTRCYPKDYEDEDIQADMQRYYVNIRNLALYDYNQIGAEYQSYSGEGAVFRNYVDRNKLLYGVLPIAVIS